MSSLEKVYGINNDIKSFAVANQFVENTNKACYKLGKFLKPFCIYGDDKPVLYDDNPHHNNITYTILLYKA